MSDDELLSGHVAASGRYRRRSVDRARCHSIMISKIHAVFILNFVLIDAESARYEGAGGSDAEVSLMDHRDNHTTKGRDYRLPLEDMLRNKVHN